MKGLRWLQFIANKKADNISHKTLNLRSIYLYYHNNILRWFLHFYFHGHSSVLLEIRRSQIGSVP